MAGDGIEVRIEGLDALREALMGLPDKLRRRALRNALAAGARVVRDAAKAGAPVLQTPTRYRSVGTVKKAVTVRTSKDAKRNGDVGVYVSVKPAKRGTRGAKSPLDPFYWRFLEFGTSKMEARPFMRPAADAKLQEALKVFEQQLGPQIQRLDTNPKDTL